MLKEMPKVGDVLILTSSYGADYMDDMTVGNEYVVTRIDNGMDAIILDDAGDERPIYVERFEYFTLKTSDELVGHIALVSRTTAAGMKSMVLTVDEVGLKSVETLVEKSKEQRKTKELQEKIDELQTQLDELKAELEETK